MKKFLCCLLTITIIALVITGCVGERKIKTETKNEIINYLNERYDDKFEYSSTYQTRFSLDGKEVEANAIFCTSDKFPDSTIWACKNDDGTFNDNYYQYLYHKDLMKDLNDIATNIAGDSPYWISESPLLSEATNVNSEITYDNYKDYSKSEINMFVIVIDISDTKLSQNVIYEELEKNIKEKKINLVSDVFLVKYDINNLDENSFNEIRSNHSYFAHATALVNTNNNYELTNFKWED